MKHVRVELVKSPAHSIPKHRATVKGLGLKRIRDQRVLLNTPEVMGMIRSVRHLVNYEEQA